MLPGQTQPSCRCRTEFRALLDSSVDHQLSGMAFSAHAAQKQSGGKTRRLPISYTHELTHGDLLFGSLIV